MNSNMNHPYIEMQGELHDYWVRLCSEAGSLVIYALTNAGVLLIEVFFLLEHDPEVPVLLWLHTLGRNVHLEVLPKLIKGFSSVR